MYSILPSQGDVLKKNSDIPAGRHACRKMLNLMSFEPLVFGQIDVLSFIFAPYTIF